MNSLRNVNFAQLLIILISWGGCAPKDKIQEEDPHQVRRDMPPTEVHVVEAVRKPFEYLIYTSGRIKAVEEVQAKFRRAGLVEKIWVRNGQHVKKGDVLAQLEFTRQQLQLEKARVQLDEKRLAFEDQMMSFKGMDSARQKQVETNVRITSGLTAAEVTYKEAALEYEHTFVRATLTGIVSGIEVKPGNPVEEGKLFCYLHNPATMAVVCDVLEVDAHRLKPGVVAEVSVAGETSTYSGRVAELNPRVDEKTGMVNVAVLLNENTAGFLPGMHVQVVLRLPYEKHLIVPKEAVVIRSGRAVVFTAEDGLAKWNYVTTGRENGKEIEIVEGLDEGKTVIVTNNLQLAHDAPVHVAKKF